MKRYLLRGPDGGWVELPGYEVAEYVALWSPSSILRLDVVEWMERAEHGWTLKIGNPETPRLVVIDEDRLIPSQILQPRRTGSLDLAKGQECSSSG